MLTNLSNKQIIRIKTSSVILTIVTVMFVKLALYLLVHNLCRQEAQANVIMTYDNDIYCFGLVIYINNNFSNKE